VWIVDFREATLDGLQRASAAELIDGDVLHPYLRPTIPQGTPTTVQDWIVVIQGLETVWTALKELEPVDILVGAAALTRPDWRRLMGLARSLGKRKVGPDDLKQLVARRGWNTGEAAKLLGMGENDAAEFLAALFYEQDKHGVWRATAHTPG
jgi:hypothetical protein